jgi:hypothetical protein
MNIKKKPTTPLINVFYANLLACDKYGYQLKLIASNFISKLKESDLVIEMKI